MPSPNRGTSKGRRITFSASGQRGTFASPEVPAEEDSLHQAAKQSNNRHAKLK